jgi:hypothetical protein
MSESSSQLILKGKQKCLTKFPSGNMPICIENYFLILQALSGLLPIYSTTIFLMNLSWTSCSWVDSSHLRQKSTSWVESFGAVDSSWDESFFVFASSRIAENCDSRPSKWRLDSLQHCKADVGGFHELQLYQHYRAAGKDRSRLKWCEYTHLGERGNVVNFMKVFLIRVVA